ncbi:hypothetical protein CEXT_740701 [Caerostris extrusa]|uniref:Uncharacterized protein n=1 Tax=Caerostris extrusa TaxID=172846 RepID=A0AAV4V605_CAEEX|nr:hypothetical protein CEXT_740701 [Caerostris extrusa]
MAFWNPAGQFRMTLPDALKTKKKKKKLSQALNIHWRICTTLKPTVHNIHHHSLYNEPYTFSPKITFPRFAQEVGIPCAG